MSFDQRECVNDIVTGTITGVMSGAVAALFVPNPPFMDLMTAGGAGGLVMGTSVLPLKWLLNRRPAATDPANSISRDSSGSHQDPSSRDAALPSKEESSS